MHKNEKHKSLSIGTIEEYKDEVEQRSNTSEKNDNERGNTHDPGDSDDTDHDDDITNCYEIEHHRPRAPFGRSNRCVYNNAMLSVQIMCCAAYRPSRSHALGCLINL